MTTYYVETYASEGSTCDPEIASHATAESAREDVGSRLRRPIGPAEWVPSSYMQSKGVPANAHALGAWHDGDSQGCGGVAIWYTD